jgi:hypothetical protein
VLEPPTAGSQLRDHLPSLVGLIVIVALLPCRSEWAASTVLVLLSLTVPGIVLLRALRIPAERIESFPLYLPAASILVLMLCGLGTDLVGPLLGVARPLHGDWTAGVTIGASLVLWLLGLLSPRSCTVSFGGWLRHPGLIVVLALPMLAAAGALLLTNGHGDLLARISALLTVLVLSFALIRAPRLSVAQIGFVLFACALATEWAFSLRSQEVIGYDIATEFYIAQHVQALGIWHAHEPNNAYAAMLSLTVLPSVLRDLTGVSALVAYKLIYPALLALVIPGIFLIAKRFVGQRFALLAASLLLVQDYFFQVLTGVARQEIATLFFVALVFVLADSDLRAGARVRLAIALSVGLVFSHYSSTYVAITIFAGATVLLLIASLVRRRILVPAALVASVAVLAGGAALWYVVITDSANELSSLVYTVEHQGLNLLPDSGGGILKSYLSGNVGRVATPAQFEAAAVRNYRQTAPYVDPLADSFDARYALRPAFVPTPKLVAPAISRAVGELYTAFSELLLALAVLGSIGMVLRGANRRSRLFGVLALSTVAFLVVIRFSGTVADFYNQSRALSQSLIIIAVPAAWAAEAAFRRLSPAPLRTIAWGLVAVGMGVVMAEQVGLLDVVLGGGTSFNLSQAGEDFERQYMTPAGLAGARWVEVEGGAGIIQSDRYGQLRIQAADGRTVLTNLTPETTDRNAWVYGYRTNVVLGRARGAVGNISSIYRWPERFLSQNFDIVFDDHDSKVYHR